MEKGSGVGSVQDTANDALNSRQSLAQARSKKPYQIILTAKSDLQKGCCIISTDHTNLRPHIKLIA